MQFVGDKVVYVHQLYGRCTILMQETFLKECPHIQFVR